MATTHASTRHFDDLDGMRGLLAVLVMLHHYGLNTIINAFVPLGVVEWTLCVDIFFLLSGLVLCRSVAGKGTGALQFAWKRFGRLFPMHWAILLIFAPVLLATGPKTGEVLHEIFVTGPLVGEAMFNSAAWSMGFEFYLPIVIVALIGILPPVSRRISTAATVAFTLVMGLLVYLILSGKAASQAGWLPATGGNRAS